MQIRFRLTLQFILITAGILLVALSYVHFQFKHNLQDEYYDNLKSKAFIIAEMVAGRITHESEFKLETTSGLDGPLAQDYPENISIYNPGGKRLYTFNPAPEDIRPVIFKDVENFGECRFVHGKFNALALEYQNKAGMEFVVVAESIFDQVYVDNLTQILILVFLISITLVAIGGWFFARQALSPVSQIMNQVDALLPTDMSHRLKTSDQHDELSRLVVTFNKLLDRIQQVFRMQKMFLSNISHELKNPLNVILSQVEVTLDKDRSKGEYEETLQSVHADIKELNEVADKLMQMARINTDAAIRLEPLRIDEIIWQTKEGLLKNHPDYKINFEVVNLPDQEKMILVEGNEQLLKTAFSNLMDNGCKFSPDKKVKVRLAFSPEVTVEISDQGPGIPEEEQLMIFNPFYRSKRTSNVKGSGIGLSLVESILKLHHVELDMKSQPGMGTSFILKFPAERRNGQKLMPA